MATKEEKTTKLIVEKNKTFSDTRIKNQKTQKDVTSEYLPKPRVKDKEKKSK